MLCVINWKKINSNKFMGNKQCNSHLPFPGQHYSSQGFFQTFPYLWPFSRVFKAFKNFYIKFKDFPYFSTICMNPGKKDHHIRRIRHWCGMGRGCVLVKQNNSSINNGTNTRGEISCGLSSTTLHTQQTATRRFY